MKSASAVHKLLLECGFRNVLWPAPLGQLWGVVGELPGDLRMVITCMPVGTERYRLHVSPPVCAEFVRELLSRHGEIASVVTDAPLDAAGVERDTPWLYVGIGAGAIALFGWVISTIVATGALHR
jgi:hypothetical protein